MRSKSLEIYLSKKEIQTFFKATNSDINYLIKNKLLKPIIKGGMILFKLGDIMDATFYLTKEVRKRKSKK